MKPVVKVVALAFVLGFVLLGSAVFVGACAYSHLRIGGGAGIEASRVETHELAFDPALPLRAQVDVGSIRVVAGSGSAAQVVATLRACGSDKAAAEKRLAAMTLDLGPNSVAGHEHKDHSLKFFEFGGGEEIDLEIKLPAGARLEVRSGSGDVGIEGAFGDTSASSDYGDVSASGIRGALIAKSSSGDMQVAEVQGPSVRVETDYGDIALRRIQSSLIEAHTSSGDIEARALETESAQLSSDYGDIALREISGELETRTSSGDVAISRMQGACRAHSDYGDVEAAGLFRGLALSSSSGSVVGRAQSGSTLAGGWELSSDYGDVLLELPAGLSFELDASTSYGEVQADLPGTLGGSKGDDTRVLRGAVGGGGPRLRLHSSSGDVAIRTR